VNDYYGKSRQLGGVVAIPVLNAWADEPAFFGLRPEAFQPSLCFGWTTPDPLPREWEFSER
jgi:hypothetical protein